MPLGHSILKVLIDYWPIVLHGVGITLFLTFTGSFAGFFIALPIAIYRTAPTRDKKDLFFFIQKFMNFIIALYVQMFRGSPMVVQAMVIYHGIVVVTGVEIDRILAGFIIVSINTGAYLTEILRSGITAVNCKQNDSGNIQPSGHLKKMKTVLPQAIRNILPAACNEIVVNIKDTSTLNVISVVELFFNGKVISADYTGIFQPYFIIFITYVILTFLLSRFFGFVIKMIDKPEDLEEVETEPSYEAVLEFADLNEKTSGG